jgi:hypothetical protein
MQNATPLFPGFHLQTLRRKPRLARQILTEKMAELKQKSFSQLSECFGKFIESSPLSPARTIRRIESSAIIQQRKYLLGLSFSDFTLSPPCSMLKTIQLTTSLIFISSAGIRQ